MVDAATVDRQLELVGGGRGPAEADDRRERAANEQDNQRRRRDVACRRPAGQRHAITLHHSATVA